MKILSLDDTSGDNINGDKIVHDSSVFFEKFLYSFSQIIHNNQMIAWNCMDYAFNALVPTIVLM